MLNIRAMTGIIRGVIAASVLGFFGYMTYGLWNMAKMGFDTYFHCKIVMMELGYAPQYLPIPMELCIFDSPDGNSDKCWNLVSVCHIIGI